MGKSQVKKKTRGTRHNPMRVPDSHLGGGAAGVKADPAKETQMLPVLNKLKSPEYADRTWACAAVCNLIQNDPATRRLFQSKNVVGALIERLSDSVDEVVVEASGALRNLAIDGGNELCAEMFNKGIMSHITVLNTKIIDTIDSIVNQTSGQQLSDTEVQSRKHLLNLSENVISLIWCLAEANHKTLAAINAAGVDGLLLRALAGREILGDGVALAAAHALYSLSQDNWTFQRAVTYQPAALAELVAVCRADHTAKGKGKGKGKGKAGDAGEDDGRRLLTRVLVAGALRNLVEAGKKADDQVDIVALTNTTILPLVNSLLDIDVPSIVARVLELSAQLPEQDITAKLGKGLHTDHKSPSEVELERIERTLMTVVIGLETLTGICAGLEDAEVGPAAEAEIVDDEIDEDAEMDEDEELADEELINLARDPSSHVDAKSSPNVATSVTLSHLLTTLSLPIRLTRLSGLTTLSFPPSSSVPSPHPPTTSVLSVLHLRALEALNNLLLTSFASLPEDAAQRSQVAGVIPSQDIWSAIFGTIDAIRSEPDALRLKGQELRSEVLEMSTGCVWGLAKINSDVLDVQAVQIRTIMDAVSVLASENAKTRCVDALGALGSRQNVSIKENKAIGTWLIALIQSPPTVELLIAGLNAIIDIYADETRSYDSVFTSEGFLDSLTAMVGKVKGEVRKIDRRKALKLRAEAEEVYENLAAFVKYRRALRQ